MTSLSDRRSCNPGVETPPTGFFWGPAGGASATALRSAVAFGPQSFDSDDVPIALRSSAQLLALPNSSRPSVEALGATSANLFHFLEKSNNNII